MVLASTFAPRLTSSLSSVRLILLGGPQQRRATARFSTASICAPLSRRTLTASTFPERGREHQWGFALR